MRRRGIPSATCVNRADRLVEWSRATLHWIRNLAARRAGGQCADDLAQQTVARILARDSPPNVRHPRALVAVVARNLAIDARRQLRARGGPALALDDLDDAAAPWMAPDQETALLLKQVILALPPIYRDTFVLNRFVGLTYAEIAQRQGITVKAVEYRMSRAVLLCAEALRD